MDDVKSTLSEAQMRPLREAVLLPLLYPDAFRALGVRAPKGVLLHGAPGTGKTLAVRALASACKDLCSRAVAFFHRSGADCLGKYAGESERTLRLLFAEARKHAPSVIFFDEIDAVGGARFGSAAARVARSSSSSINFASQAAWAASRSRVAAFSSSVSFCT